MSDTIDRRKFLKRSVVLPVIAAAGMNITKSKTYAQSKINRAGGPSLKTSCCGYSYRKYLSKGEWTYDDFLETVAKLGFDGAELTAYYFENYPEKPSDKYLYHLKKKAFLLGLDINGSSCGNNFVKADKSERKEQIEYVKRFVECSNKLGAPEMRVFGGSRIPDGYSEKDAINWIVECMKECADYAGKYGVILALENHGGIPDKGETVLEILKKVNSEWLAGNLDTGNFGQTGDPYKHIEMVAPYTITCHVKVSVSRGEELDAKRVVDILRKVNYRGYLPIEYEEKEDPITGVPKFLKKIEAAIGS